MQDEEKTKAQLIAEVQALRTRLGRQEQEPTPVFSATRPENTQLAEQDLLYFLSRLVKVGAWQFTPQTGISTWTEEVYRIFDMPPDQQAGPEQGLSYFHGVNRAKLEQAFHQAVTAGIPYDLELELLSAQGVRKWVRAIARPERLGQEVLRVQGVIQDITERKQAEESLRMTQFIFAKAPLGIWRMGTNGEVLDVNEQGAQSLGYSRNQLRQMTVFDFAPGFSPEEWVQGLATLEENGSTTIEAQHQRKNGEIFPIQVIQNLLRFEGQEFHVAFVQDITQRKKMEESLRLARFIIDNANIGILLIDNQGRIREANQKAAKTLGYSKEELESLLIADIDPEVARDSWQPHWQSISRVASRCLERANQKKDGTLIPIEIRSNFLHYKGQEYVVAFIQDISERKQNEKAIREKDSLLQDIGRLVKVGAWQIDVTTGEATSTDEVARIYDLEPTGDIKLERGFRYYHGKNRAIIQQALQQAMEYGIPYDLELEIISAQGIHKWVRTIGNPIREQGRIIRVQGSFQDITEQKILEEQIQQTRKLEAIGQLAGGIAHDFNNMLTGIKGAAEVLDHAVADVPKAKKYIDIIHTATDRTASLVEKLLAFGRKGKQFSSPVNLHTLLRDTLILLQSTIDRRIVIQTALQAEQVQVVGDSGQLQSCLLNLFLNARDAMPNGGILHIATHNQKLDESAAKSQEALDPGPYICLVIRDSGHGIPPEVLPHIFEPFFSTKATGEGAGLGLAAVYGTIKDHHGDIRVESIPGEQTTFSLLLPVEPMLPHPQSPQETDNVVFGNGTILLADDEEIIRITGEILLEEIGYDLILAEQGQQAVQIYQDQQDTIDLIILDVVMPVMDGKEAYSRLRQIDREVPIIFCSGYTKDVSLTELTEDKNTAFIMKPFEFTALSKLIADMLAPK